MIIEVFAERRRFGVDARGGLRRDSKPEHLFELDADGELHVLSGLVPRLAAAARRAGYPVELQDLAEPTVPASAPDGADLDDDGQRLAAILRGAGGPSSRCDHPEIGSPRSSSPSASSRPAGS